MDKNEYISYLKEKNKRYLKELENARIEKWELQDKNDHLVRHIVTLYVTIVAALFMAILGIWI